MKINEAGSIPMAERVFFFFFFLIFTRWIASVHEQNTQSFLYSADLYALV